MPAVDDKKKKLLASKKGLIGSGSGVLESRTSYGLSFPPPPKSLYTGVSAGLGLKAKVEGTAVNDPSNLGLGEEGRSFYQRELVHYGDAYKTPLQPEDRARRTNVKPPKDAKVDYTTSYSGWGKKVDLGEGNKVVEMPKPVFKPPEYGMGEDGRSMMKDTFIDPRTQPDYLATARITKSQVEGNAEVVMEPYGPLAKSFMHEDFGAPPKEAYLQNKKSGEPKQTFKSKVVPVGTTQPNAEEKKKYGLGQFGTSLYKDTFIPLDQKSASQRPNTGLGARVRQGSIKLGGALYTRTSYVDAFPPPPKSLYTGVSAGLGLKAKVEGTAVNDPSNLGLGEEGRSFYQRELVHYGDAYKTPLQPEDRARRTNVKPPKDAKVDYTTSYSGWGKKVDLGEGNKVVEMPKPVFKPPEYGMGEDGRSMMKDTFIDPRTQPDYLATARITKSQVEGNAEVVMEPYGPLAKSFMHEDFGAPPKEAYLQNKKSGEPKQTFKSKVVPVGTTQPNAEEKKKYGIGAYGFSTYKQDFVPKLGLGVTGASLVQALNPQSRPQTSQT